MEYSLVWAVSKNNQIICPILPMFLEKITLFFSGGILSYVLDTFTQIYPKNHHNLWRKMRRKCPV